MNKIIKNNIGSLKGVLGAIVTCLLVCGLNCSRATAESKNIEEQEQLVVSPHRRPGRISDVGSSIDVITARDIVMSGAQSVSEVLRRLPGVEVVQVGGAGRTATTFIRGGESDHVSVLIDGVRVNTVADGSFDFADLRVTDIERIEVLKGPQSVIYGSEALGGVISIVTNRGYSGSGLSVSAEGGSYSSQDYSVRAAYDGEGVTSSTGLSFSRTEGISVALPRSGNGEDDGYENLTLGTSNDFRFSPEWGSALNVRYQRGDAQLDGFDFSRGPVDDLNFTQRRNLVSGLMSLSRKEGMIRPNISLGYMYEELEGFDPDTSYNGYDIRNSGFTPTVQLDLYPVDWSVSSFGLVFEERAANNLTNFDRSRQVYAGYFNQQFNLSDSDILTAGVRYDDYSDFGDYVNYRTTLSSLRLNGLLRFHSSLGSGFKAPTFNELYFPQFGNEDLDPEKTRGFDAGIEMRLLDGRVTNDLTFFRSDYRDLITFSVVDFTAQNIESSRAIGVEERLSLVVAPSTTISVGYVYTDSRNDTSRDLLPRRPVHRATLEVNAEPIKDWQINLFYLMVKDRIDSSSETMDDYERVDALVRYNARSIRPYVRIVNFFDTRYEEVTGYGTPGLSVFGGLEMVLM
jgi:vitamin B12 transporter